MKTLKLEKEVGSQVDQNAARPTIQSEDDNRQKEKVVLEVGDKLNSLEVLATTFSFMLNQLAFLQAVENCNLLNVRLDHLGSLYV